MYPLPIYVNMLTNNTILIMCKVHLTLFDEFTIFRKICLLDIKSVNLIKTNDIRL